MSSIIGALGSLLGGLFGQQNSPSKAENQLYQQEAQQMAQMFPQFMGQESQLASFFSPYMSSGSPFLKNIQAAAAGQNANNYNTAAGTTRGQLMQGGMGFGPSGAAGATIGGMGVQQANNASSNYLQNLLSNENLKFQAAQGLQGVASAMRPGQPATVGGSYTPSGLPGAIQNAGNALGAGLSQINNQAPPTTGGMPIGPVTTSGFPGIPTSG